MEYFAAIKEWQALVGAGVAIFALVIAWFNVSRQMKLSIKSSVGSNTMKLIEYLQSEKIRSARYASAKIDIKDLENLSEEDKFMLSTACSSYDLAGIYAKNGYVDEKLIIDSWGPSIIRTYEMLSPYIKARRAGYSESYPSGSVFWDDFEWLYTQALKFHGHRTEPQKDS